MYLIFVEFTIRSLLVTKSFLTARKITSANFVVSSQLLDLGFGARAEYRKYLTECEQKRKTEEAAKLVEEERLALVSKLEKDKEKRTVLLKIDLAFQEVS